MTLTVGSLFSGIGGLDLGLERAGMRVIWQSEIDPYASRVLAKHWPEVPNHGDIKKINWQNIEKPDVLCGGYPCQPFSHAGKRQGEKDPRHLWPWVRDAISELRPRYAILENVRGHLSLGGVSVIGELAAIGYDAEWCVISASSVGAPHRRDRLVIVAHPDRSHPTNGGQRPPLSGESDIGRDDRSGSGCHVGQIGIRSSRENPETMADPNDSRSRTPERDLQREKPSHLIDRVYSFAESSGHRESLRTIPDFWKTQPGVGRVAYGIPNRVDRLRGLGNAVVPQVAEVIGRLVVAHHKEMTIQ